MLRDLRPLLLLALAQACAPLQSSPSAAAEGEQGMLALVVRGDTTVREEYTRTAGALEGVVRPQGGAKFGWARYRVRLAPGGAVERAELELGRPGTTPGDPAAGRWVVTVADGAVEEVPDRGAARRVAAPAGVVPYFAPSMAMLHEVVRRALPLRGTAATAAIPTYPFPGDGRLDTLRVRWVGTDTVEVAGGGATTRVAVDARGRLVGSRTADGAFVGVRLPHSPHPRSLP